MTEQKTPDLLSSLLPLRAEESADDFSAAAHDHDAQHSLREASSTPTAESDTPAQLTPLMAQYKSLKDQYTDCYLFFRLGDFYELFFSDAVEVSALLNLTLTSRGKSGDGRIPMCGVPYHAVDNYIAKLIAMGKKIAIAEQTENATSDDGKDGANKPAKPAGKNLMARHVVRIITPGTVFEETLLPERQNNFLMAVAMSDSPSAKNEKQMTVAITDVSTGFLAVEGMGLANLSSFISKWSPAEIVVPDILLKDEMVASALRDFYEKITPEAMAVFNKQRAVEMIQAQFHVKSLAGFGDFSPDELSALGGLLAYLKRTQIDALPKLLPPKKIDQSDFVSIDRASFQSLEILSNNHGGGRAGSLLELLDRTETAAGARLLRERLQQPLKNVEKIIARLDLLQFFVDQQKTSNDIKNHLVALPDLSRALARLAVKKGGPRDLAAVAQVLAKIPALKNTLRQLLPGGERQLSTADKNPDGVVGQLLDSFPDVTAVKNILQQALRDDNLPLLPRDGHFIRPGFRADLDAINNQQKEKRRQLQLLEQKYRQLTGIDNLKIKQNNIWGFYIEVAARQADKMAKHNIFQHRQTLSALVRYNSAELIAMGTDIERGDNQSLALELQIFDELVAVVLAEHEPLMATAHAVAVLDVNQTMATLARTQRFVRPTILAGNNMAGEGGGKLLRLARARHPVVEHALSKQANHFAANDIMLDDKKFFMLLTAPNMAGKSTFLRMVAIIVIMAQSGFYVPADEATISVVDKIFSRVGAADDLARGQSTFMVEMLETANILQNATAQSLVIMDEIGRGTATFDGLSLAIAITEYLNEKIKGRVLFATHYHELTKLADHLPAIACFTMRVEEWEKKLVFFHELIAGRANHSYGIHVAAMAGVPPSVVARAGDILKELENKK
ncbi:MAG: DNA mismatch repair protein MutS [Hydrotalea sp.]|nr:DNA mismatch repair protein MutS [Hydrotalea sp.]